MKAGTFMEQEKSLLFKKVRAIKYPKKRLVKLYMKTDGFQCVVVQKRYIIAISIANAKKIYQIAFLLPIDQMKFG